MILCAAYLVIKVANIADTTGMGLGFNSSGALHPL